MSTSRLEKFIYAICSMEVSDLPAPISRIEILWNCLITGETPDFEPQSRNEQYLMAMLGLYELENLPAPMSRGEKLLYKIAMGETDLSDVPGYLSRYEELLGYLAENGGVGDFEYILQTLNQRLSTLYSTKERPVKSAILKGQTLVNLVDSKVIITQSKQYMSVKNLVANKKYIAIFPYLENTEYGIFNLGNAIVHYTTTNKIVFTTPSTIDEIRLYVSSKDTTVELPSNALDIVCVEYQDGMENWDIPYFEGMQSVKMPVLTTTGKNLFDVNEFAKKCGGTVNGNEYDSATSKTNAIYDIFIPKNATISYMVTQMATVGAPSSSAFAFIEESGQYYHRALNNLTRYDIIAPKNFVGIKIINYCTGWKFSEFQIKQGTQATPYEPFKSNILTVNEEVELRGIGDVQDTLDCLTGELTERIGEWVFNGTQSINKIEDLGGYVNIRFTVDGVKKGTGFLANNIYCDVLPVVNDLESEHKQECIKLYGQGSYMEIRLTLSKTKVSTNANSVNTYLQSNPITVQYRLANESIKTVDLTTVDQDGKPTKLKTYNDITYVEINSENIMPSVELEIATKISETLSTMGLQHLELSETQNKLGQTIDEQTENTDAAMLATTEIYEQTL